MTQTLTNQTFENLILYPAFWIPSKEKKEGVPKKITVDTKILDSKKGFLEPPFIINNIPAYFTENSLSFNYSLMTLRLKEHYVNCWKREDYSSPIKDLLFNPFDPPFEDYYSLFRALPPLKKFFEEEATQEEKIIYFYHLNKFLDKNIPDIHLLIGPCGEDYICETFKNMVDNFAYYIEGFSEDYICRSTLSYLELTFDENNNIYEDSIYNIIVQNIISKWEHSIVNYHHL